MARPIEPGPYRYELETSQPAQHHFGGEIEAAPAATEEGLLGFILGHHFPRGTSVTVTRFNLTRR